MYVCTDFPDDYIGIRFYDAWTNSQSGGLPLDNIEKERKAFAKNPQYYINVREETTIHIKLVQNDARIKSEDFPFNSHFIKNCLVLTPVKSKQSLEAFENNIEVEISLVNSFRENTIIKSLKPGTYILSACCLYEGTSGYFSLQFNFEDRFRDEDVTEINFLTKLKKVYIERLNDIEKIVKCKFSYKQLICYSFHISFKNILGELIREGTYDETRAKSKRKCEFLFNNFGKIIKHNDEKLFNVLKPIEINSKSINEK